MSELIPSLFVAHGAPLLALDAHKGADYRRLAAGLPAPRAILCISAHWETTGAVRIGAAETLPLIYDFYGFPAPLYDIRYAPPGAPWLADEVARLLAPIADVVREPARGWDHGVWVPLLHMYPAADVPVLQLSLPRDRDPRALYALGEALAPLRAQRVLLMGSGNITHNLRDLDISERAPTAPWAREFDAWMADALARKDLPALFDYRARAPHAVHAHPRDEHLTPLFVAMGAGGEAARVSFPIEGFEYQNLSRRCVAFG